MGQQRKETFTFKIHLPNYQHSKFALANSKRQGFCWAISSFLVSALTKKKNAGTIELYGIFKKNISKNKKYIFLFAKEKKRFALKQKSSFCFSHNFETWFHDTDDCFHYPQMSVSVIHRCLFSLFKLLLHSYISLQEMGHGKNTTVTFLSSYKSKSSTKWIKKEA